MKQLLLMIASLALPLHAGASAPSINVGSMYEYAEPGKGALLKRVRNTGDATAFVRVQVTEVQYGADGKATENDVDTSSIGNGRPALIASPSRLIVPAQGQQATRLLLQGNRQVERYYRVRFIPVLPRSENEFALSPVEAEEYRKHLSAGVNVLTGYGVFVIVRPDSVHYDVRTEADANGTVLRNTGNTTVILDDLRHCSVQEKDERCSPARRLHLLPGRSHHFPRTGGEMHRFHVVEGDARKAVRIDS